MKKTLFFYCLLIVAMTFVSCEKFAEDEGFGGAEANSTLVIRTRAAMAQVDGEAKVSYPVNVYVFNGDDACVDVATITSDADELRIALPEGSYHVYAIAGADAETYELPTKENATKETAIVLKAGQEHGDLMAASNAVTLGYGEENTLTLSLERKVMMLENVTINNVPGSVTAVSVTLNPLYENLLLDGTCLGKDGSYTLNLTREGETGTWKNDAGVYMLAAAAAATVKVSFTASGKVQSYSYSCTENLEANYKVNISGTYTDDGVEMKGQIIGETWEGTKNVVFNFGKAGSEETVVPDGDDEEDNATSSDSPVVGQLYKNDCYVLKREGNVYTLMTVACVNGVDGFEDSKGNVEDQENLHKAVNEALESLVVDGISGWRLPNIEEVAYTKEIGYDIQKFFEDNVSNDEYRMNMGGYLLYERSDGKIYGYSMSSNTATEVYPTPGGSSYVLRAFTTVTFP